jgi:hypothetical protein
MASEAQKAANRRNAQASTGPRTPAGKARVRRNAVTHGLCAETTPDDGEDAAAFARLYRSLMQTYGPLTDEEQTQVARIASLKWRLMRVPAVENALYARVEADLAANDDDPVALPAVWAEAFYDPAAQRAQGALQRYEAHLSRQLAAAHQTFKALRATLQDTHPPVALFAEDPELAEESAYFYAEAFCGQQAWHPFGRMPGHGLDVTSNPYRQPGNDDDLPDTESDTDIDTGAIRADAPPTDAAHREEPPPAASRTAHREEPPPAASRIAHREEPPPAASRTAHREEPPPAASRTAHREEPPQAASRTTIRQYPPGHQTFGDPHRLYPKMNKAEVAAWRPPGDSPQPGNYVYPDGRSRYWPGDAVGEEGERG